MVKGIFPAIKYDTLIDFSSREVWASWIAGANQRTPAPMAPFIARQTALIFDPIKCRRWPMFQPTSPSPGT